METTPSTGKTVTCADKAGLRRIVPSFKVLTYLKKRISSLRFLVHTRHINIVTTFSI